MTSDPSNGPVHPRSQGVSRRQALGGLLVGSAAAAVGYSAAVDLQAADAQSGPAVTNGRIKQSVAFWCFNAAGEKWDLETTCKVAKELGCLSVELAAPEGWDTLKKYGLVCAMAPNGMPGAPFIKGVNNTKYHEQVITNTKKAIDDCAAAKFPNVIAFTGYKYRDATDPQSGELTEEETRKNSIKALKMLASYAEKKGVNVCVEHLNTRDDTHPMKGHPGYQGDDLDWVAETIRQVGSPRIRLLFDIYHVQIMHGDVIRRLEETKDIIGHIHTAGNPGRGELDQEQELQYPAIMRKLLAIKYDGYVGQEFIPTRNPRAGLHEAVSLCDV